MKNLVLVAFLLFSGCAVTKPTYLELSEKSLNTVAARLGTDIDTALEDQREALRRELSKDLGMQVDELFVGHTRELTADFKGAVIEVLDQTDASAELKAAIAETGLTDDTRRELTKALAKEIDDLMLKHSEEKLTVEAEIEPAIDDAAKKALTGPLTAPTQPERWIGGGLAGLGVLLMGLLGARGQKKRKTRLS